MLCALAVRECCTHGMCQRTATCLAPQPPPPPMPPPHSICCCCREASLPYINKKTCQTNAKNKYYVNIPVTQQMMCAGEQKHGCSFAEH